MARCRIVGSVGPPLKTSVDFTLGSVMALALAIKRYFIRLCSGAPSPNGPVLVSFPKSGRTWVRVMLDRLNIVIEYSHTGSEHIRPADWRYLQIPFDLYRRRKLVFLHRDPRDTAVSGFFQCRLRLKNFDGTMSDFIRDPRHGIEKIVHFNLAWMSQRSTWDHILFVSYEDLSNDTGTHLRRLATFLSSNNIISSKIENALEYAQFENMQRREMRQAFSRKYGRTLRPGDAADTESFKVRKGKIGGFTEYLTQGDIDYCNKILEERRYFETAHLLG